MNRKRAIIITLFLVGLAVVASYLIFSWYQKKNVLETRLNESRYTDIHREAYLSSLTKHDPTLLQESFATDINYGINDKFTKADAYFLTHRYFDNGGDVYEIYDYIESRPQLAFLKEAESIYPSIFREIEDRSLTTIPYSVPSLYAMLAYLEVLDKHGYADLAAQGTLANQYAKTAYFIKKRSEGRQLGKESGQDEQVVQTAIKKAISFEVKARNTMMQTLESNGFDRNNLQGRLASLEERPLVDIVPHSFLVGMNQYAACLRYLEAAGADISVINSPLSAAEIFAFNMEFSKKYATELHIFTSLLNASTLSLVTDDAGALKRALGPIIGFNLDGPPKGIIFTILNAQNDTFSGRDIYNRINIVTLANRVPEFKDWLIKNGWPEANFSL